jgi:hypothetical protein
MALVTKKVARKPQKPPKPRKPVKKTVAKEQTKHAKEGAAARAYENEMQRLRPIVHALLRNASPATTGRASIDRKIKTYLPQSPPTQSILNAFLGNHKSYPTQFRRFRRELYEPGGGLADGYYHSKP